MYQYDRFDQTIVDERVEQYRDQVRRRLSGELSEEEFRPLRLQNGLYLQRHAYMLRVAIPMGICAATRCARWPRSRATMTATTAISRRARTSSTTGSSSNRPPDILRKLADVQMHAIQTSGNCIRNITADQFAGVAPDEIVDPRPYAEIMRQWSTFHPEFAWLPRKFKIAVSGTVQDRAAVLIHDLGVYLSRDAEGQVVARVLAGGGLGRTPIIGSVIKENLPWQHLLTYAEAVLRVYNRYGRRDNIYKARIKILVKALGAEKFAEQVEAEWAHLKDGPATITQEELERVSAGFAPPAYEKLANIEPAYEKALLENRQFARWVERNVRPHRVPGYASVTLSLKPGIAPPGDASSAQMFAVADWADAYSFGEVRVTHEQNLVLADVRKRDLYKGLGACEVAELRDGQHRPADRHHRVPGRRFLLARKREVDPDRARDPEPFRRSRLCLRSRRAVAEYLGLHEFVRPSPRRQYRRARRRQGRRGVVPGLARRRAGRGRQARARDRAVVQGRADAGRGLEGDRDLRRAPRRR